MKRSSFFAFVILTALGTAFTSCKEDKYKVDTEKVQIDVSFRRLDRDLFPLEKKSADEILREVKSKYPDFYPEYFGGVLSLGNPDVPEFNIPLAGFLGDIYIKQLVDEVNKNYSQTEPQEKELTDAFKRYHTFVPGAVVPNVIFCISGLNYSVVATDSVLAIGLDMFLGSDFEPYKAMSFPEYILARKNKEHLLPEVLQGWLLTEFGKNPTKNSLVDHMVYQGKIMFLLGIMLPQYGDDKLFGYSKETVAFIEGNEAQIWASLLEKKLLFVEDKREIMKIMDEAPFAAGMPREVPGRIGMWVGRNMVESYMENNPSVTIPQLMADDDYKTIFTKSKYKPRLK